MGKYWLSVLKVVRGGYKQIYFSLCLLFFIITLKPLFLSFFFWISLPLCFVIVWLFLQMRIRLPYRGLFGVWRRNCRGWVYFEGGGLFLGVIGVWLCADCKGEKHEVLDEKWGGKYREKTEKRESVQN